MASDAITIDERLVRIRRSRYRPIRLLRRGPGEGTDGEDSQ